MNLKLKSKRILKTAYLLSFGLLLISIIFLLLIRTCWTQLDFQVLDLFYKLSVKYGYSPKESNTPKVVNLYITADTYKYFRKNVLNRADLSKVNDVLSELKVKAVGYDIIFRYPSDSISDLRFKESLKNLPYICLPISFELSDTVCKFKWEDGTAFDRLKRNFLKKPKEEGKSQPFYSCKATMQVDDFAEVSSNFGHINVESDSDGVYRHCAMIVKVDSLYLPTLALSIFLDYAGLSLNDCKIHWGKEILIPAKEGSNIDKDVIIPIDNRGRAFIPYTQTFEKSFERISADSLLENFKNPKLKGNLIDLFEDNLVIIGDIAQGTADIGQTPLEGNVPLVAAHSSILNGLLTNTFYKKWSLENVVIMIFVITILLMLSTTPKPLWVLYATGTAIAIGIITLTFIQFIQFSLFPIATVGIIFLFIFFGLVIGLQLSIHREEAFIQSAFSRYVPEKVVNQLLEHPELLKLGGEKRELTILFSDLAGFTTISEKMPPEELVKLLNEYLTEMTGIILSEGGIIDKYQGDAIMAEFGAPIPVKNHADMAVRTGLKMLRRLKELQQEWAERNFPKLSCRIGINTGTAILGNMGSNQVFDYTVIGDAVNLASRLESANKQYGTYFMISEFTYNQLTPNTFRTRVLDVIKVKGKSKAVKVFEVYGELSQNIPDNDLTYYQTYNSAFEDYLSRNFESAREKFKIALSLRPDDIASKQMIERIDSLDRNNLPNDWDGSVALTSK